MKEPPLEAAGAGLGPGAGTIGALRQFPDWHPAPQCALVFPQNPYIEQQFPFIQLPHKVFPFPAPQVPSFVTAAVAVAPGGIDDETGPITGS